MMEAARRGERCISNSDPSRSSENSIGRDAEPPNACCGEGRGYAELGRKSGAAMMQIALLRTDREPQPDRDPARHERLSTAHAGKRKKRGGTLRARPEDPVRCLLWPMQITTS